MLKNQYHASVCQCECLQVDGGGQGGRGWIHTTVNRPSSFSVASYLTASKLLCPASRKAWGTHNFMHRRMTKRS